MAFIFKKEWVAALRSGKYHQIPDLMTDNAGGFCAMGVLADVYAKAKNVDFWDAVMDVASTGAYPVPNRTFAAIAAMNDDGYSFNRIADEIESGTDENLNTDKYLAATGQFLVAA